MELMFAPVSNPDFQAITSRPLFTAEECDRIIDRCDPDAWSSAKVELDGGQAYGDLRPEERSVTHQLIPVDAEGWPVTALRTALAAINDEIYRFRLSQLPASDAPSVLRYETATNDHFRPHTDTGRANATRKLSYSVQLSDPSSYEGCDLVFPSYGSQAARGRGAITVFPSFLFHTVTPVYAGIRYAIVGWAHGPTFR